MCARNHSSSIHNLLSDITNTDPRIPHSVYIYNGEKTQSSQSSEVSSLKITDQSGLRSVRVKQEWNSCIISAIGGGSGGVGVGLGICNGGVAGAGVVVGGVGVGVNQMIKYESIRMEAA